MPGRPLGTLAAEHAVAEGSLWAGDLVSVRAEAGTLIADRTTSSSAFYAPDDVLERTPLDGAAAPETLRRALDALPPPRTRDEPRWEPDPEQLEQLRSLGYVR
jgi:hypothetical protein